MTKSITGLAREANLIFPGTDCIDGDIEQLDRFAALHRAAILEELTGEMPEPEFCMAYYGPYEGWGDISPEHAVDQAAVGFKIRSSYTADQMREYAAGLVVRKDAEIAELKDELATTNSEAVQRKNDWSAKAKEVDALRAENLGYAKALLDLEAEVKRLTADARRYQWLRELPNADSLNVTYMGTDLDMVIDAALEQK
jgi:hypothetical protein